ncbi:unnamed protein product [Eruca vesicaria subsp. sativa]|uniref:PB1 domain-containing protein n=1 Tax=Eruca vesicaria subsp. sativa TaxID=29727 RepID=A0ABC8K0U4_ERUVS|nr:unnamed protein product [Eruca vesicaria subsp. sativa]
MEPQTPSLNSKLRLLCSYGGRITPIPPSNTLEYIGGETRIVAVPRDISFSSFFQLLSVKLLYGRTFSLKYRLPGCDLDSLVTVNDNEDLQNMIAEYDSASPDRIRLFLFPFESSTRHPLSANFLGLESPIQKIIYTSSSSVAPFPIFPQSIDTGVKRVDHGKSHATSEDTTNDEDHITSASELNSEAEAGVLDKETERVENKDEPRRIVVQESFQQQQFLPIIYLPVLPMQPHMVTRSVNGYALSPAMECSPGVDPVLENKESTT